MAEDETAQVPMPESASLEAVPQAPASVETPAPEPVGEQAVPEAPTAQIPASEPFDPAHAEPLPPEPGPIEPTPVPEPPQVASAPTPASTSSPQATHPPRDLLVKARATIQDRKHKKLEKIMEALNAKGKITNDEVEKLLHVSDATATRYLSALEKEGKIQQVGKTGKAVEYTRI